MSLMDPGSVRNLTATTSRAPSQMSYLFSDRWAAALNGSFTAALCKVELRRLSGLREQDRKHWTELSARATPGNIFAQDWFMEPALRHCGKDWSLRLAIVRQASGAWLGVVPLTFAPTIGHMPTPCWQSWHAEHQFLATPLVLPGAEKAFWQVLLAWLDREPRLAFGLSVGPMPVCDPVTLALASLCAEQGRPLHVGDSFTRPARLAASRPDRRAQRLLDTELDGLEAKLAAERGPVRLVMHESGTDCDPWAAAFLALERAGGNGRGTRAPAGNSANADLFREVIRHGHRSGTVRLASLTAGETIVAMTSWFVAGGYGYGFKIAFDNSCRDAGPGRLLMRRVARALDEAAPVLFDTCADRDMPSDPLWPDRRALGRFIVAIGGARRRRLFDGLMQFKASRDHGN